MLPGAFPCPHDLRLPWLSSQVVEAIEYLKRPERLGLGAASVLPASKPNKQRKMGEGVHLYVCVRGGSQETGRCEMVERKYHVFGMAEWGGRIPGRGTRWQRLLPL